MKEELKIRPYARLLTMLGDQLIKNEQVALTELVKNAYDADANFCNIKFINFTDDGENTNNSCIAIEDDGYGMSYEIVTKHFLNPATPIKKIGVELRKSKKGRVCQGEKGIGRFSMLKLGKVVTIISKEKENPIIHKVLFDFQKYDEDFLTELEKSKEIFLDDIIIKYDNIDIDTLPKDCSIVQNGHGTIIKIESLKGDWNEDKIRQLSKDMTRFTPFEVDDDDIVDNKDFSINILVNGQLKSYRNDDLEKIKNIVFNKALYKVKGEFIQEKKILTFSYVEANKAPKTVKINLSTEETQDRASLDFKGLTVYRKELEKYFDGNSNTTCGSFKFHFYIFNFSANPSDPYGLSIDEKNIIRDHRVFLYRDDIRVQPYGSVDDDWLQIDRKRAADKAGNMFSNDQLFGQIKITKANNKTLIDKTSREGIIEDNDSFKQLITIVRGLLAYFRTKIYQNYIFTEQKKKEIKNTTQQEVKTKFKELKEILKDDTKSLNVLGEIEKDFNKQEEVYKSRLDTAERLAGVGLSVEAVSHDIMITIDRLKDNIHQIFIDTSSPMFADLTKIHKNSETAEGLIGLVYMKMKDLQQLFVSSKQRPKLTNVIDIVKKIQSIYAKQYNDSGIKVEYEIVGSPVKAKIIDAVLYQVFINLFDNALYWLKYIDGERKVKIKFDGFSQSIIFSDNGIGISNDDAPFIFEAFYSGKGDEGRGLGLYIAQKLLNKYDYDISLLTKNYEKIQNGANFLLSFITEDRQ